MTVLELARKSGVGGHVIRYYARIGLLQPTRHSRNGYKLFVDSDVSNRFHSPSPPLHATATSCLLNLWQRCEEVKKRFDM
jgi:MerR HTH family regulatory protein